MSIIIAFPTPLHRPHVGPAAADGSATRDACRARAFHARVRDELLNGEQFACIAEARVLIGDWREDYNTRRPHSALGMRAPAVFAAAHTPAADA